MQNIYSLKDKTLKNKTPLIDPTAWIAPTACLIGEVTIGKDSSIWFNCVLRADINKIVIGDATNIQDGCLMHVTNKLDLHIGDRVTVGHGAILHGCRIDSDCLIGMGAIVLDGAQIGEHSLIAAGTVVSPGTQIPPNSLVMGTPGKVIREIRPGDRTMIDAGAQNYVSYKDLYKSGLQ